MPRGPTRSTSRVADEQRSLADRAALELDAGATIRVRGPARPVDRTGPARRLRRQRRDERRASSSTAGGCYLVLHGLDTRRDRPVHLVDRLRGERRRRRRRSEGLAGARARPHRRRSVPDGVTVGARRGRSVAHVVRLRHAVGFVERQPRTGTTSSTPSRTTGSVAPTRRRLHRLRERGRARDRAAVRRQGRRSTTGCGTARGATATASATPSRRTALRGRGTTTQAGIAPSDEGWDAEMVAYPLVFEPRGRRCHALQRQRLRPHRASAGPKRSRPIEALHPLPELVRLRRLDLPGMRVPPDANGVSCSRRNSPGSTRASKPSPSTCFPPLRTRASGSKLGVS